MADLPKSPKLSTSFGINTIHNIITSMPEQPVLNIQCQSRSQIKDAITMMFHWAVYKRMQDPTITGQTLGAQIVAGLSGLANDWWRWLPQEARNELLNANDADQQILLALGKEFHGADDVDDSDHLASLYMSAHLCDLSQEETYFCYM